MLICPHRPSRELKGQQSAVLTWQIGVWRTHGRCHLQASALYTQCSTIFKALPAADSQIQASGCEINLHGGGYFRTTDSAVNLSASWRRVCVSCLTATLFSRLKRRPQCRTTEKHHSSIRLWVNAGCSVYSRGYRGEALTVRNPRPTSSVHRQTYLTERCVETAQPSESTRRKEPQTSCQAECLTWNGINDFRRSPCCRFYTNCKSVRTRQK